MTKAPKAYDEFTARFPLLDEAWNKSAEAGKDGPLDDKTCRLIKLAVAIGAQKEGPAHASVRKADKLGITREEMEQVVALASSTIGFPSSVAAWCWINDVLDK